MKDVFVSYSRRDSAFCHQLVDALQAHGQDVWVDFEGIPFASDWWEEIKNGIEAAQAAVFIISPDSVSSEVCSLEVNHIISNNKKLIPVLYRPINTDDLHIPPAISHLNWIFFDDPEQFDAAVVHLLETLATDLDVRREHTRLLTRAREWDNRGRNDSLLLRGDDLLDVRSMVARADLIDVQRDYLTESIQQYERNQLILKFVFGFTGGFLGMGFYVFSVFRSEMLFTPIKLAYTMSAGEIFGVFVGMMAMMAHGLPVWMRNRVPVALQPVLRVLLCWGMGTLSWLIFQWYFLDLPFALNLTLIVGGFSLAFSFMVYIFIRLHALLMLVLTAITVFLPVYFLNNQATLLQQTDGLRDNPLLYFDQASHVLSVGVPFALLVAVGANGQLLWQVTRDWLHTFHIKRQSSSDQVSSAA